MTEELHEELAVMEGVDIGMRDCNTPVLWFSARGLHYSSLQVLNWEQAQQLIRDAKVYSVKQLNGHTCVMETSDSWGGSVKFVKLC